jgi:lipopolysaccharide export system protein LptA
MKWRRAAALWLFVPATALAQGLTPCDLSANGGFSSEIVGGIEIGRGGGGVTVVCRSRNLKLYADSGEAFGNDRIELYGKVHYEEPTRIDLRSDRLTYILREEMVIVRGHVIATQPNGSTLTGPEATYFRAVPRVRTIEELNATSGPTVTIAPRNKNEKPVVVNANTIYMRGDSLIYASRNVVIDRADLLAKSDSAFVDGRSSNETMRLLLKPSVEGREGRRFKLEGDVIDAYSKDRKLQRVISRGKGHAISEDLDIVADTIDLRMSNDKMERAIAWNRAGQAKATAPGEVITADSIDARMPGQKLRVVYAVGNARADADADTVRLKTTERDWLRGDVVTAWFDSTATKDTSKTPPIDRILTTHKADSAQAYYHMPASEPSCKDAAISYVRGREILIDFDNRKIGIVSVRDSVVGMYLEPKCQTAKDSATAKAAGKPPARSPSRPPALVR